VAVREDETADIVFAMDLGNKFGNSAEVAYAVEDLEIAQISDGKVLGVSEGTTTLYATHVATGTTVQATITVTPKPQPEAPTAVTFAGEDVVGNDEYEIVDGEILYRYDVHVEDLPEGGSYVSSAQIFLAYDPAVLALRKTEGAFDWTVNDKNGTISAVWASDTEQLVQNGEEVLTLWFAKIGDAEKTDVAFTENTLGTGSSIGFAANGSVVELEAGTADGSITFDAILYGDANCDGMITAADAALVLRSIVGLSALTKRGALNAEVDGDGSVTAADAAAILRYVVGLIRELPVRN
ncbi:MAG: dockerin type I repeat-containing protein, partial [Clostridia bacterium]|nr:dockerin type I repeat-containing protein [Clostridia bacterium]